MVVGHPPLLECGVEEEPLHDLEVVVVVVPAVVNRLLLGDQRARPKFRRDERVETIGFALRSP